MFVYGNEKGDIFFRELPFLDFKKKFEVSPNWPINTILASKDKRYIFCGGSSGEFAFLTDPNTGFQNYAQNIEGSHS